MLGLFQHHGTPLALAYLVALSGWLLASRLLPSVWPDEPPRKMARAWREFGIAMLGVVGILVMGQLWVRRLLLPEEGVLAPLLSSINQIVIFAPILLVVVIRRQPWTSAWLPRPRIPTRLFAGVVLAGLAVTVYSLLRSGADAPWILFGRIWGYQHIDEMVQVLLEDVAIAIVFVRLAGAIGNRWATVVVACLFAAAHIPSMISQGATSFELAALVRDAGLGVAVILVLQRSRDVVWFWCVHFCLDMTQFGRISGVE